MNLTINRVDLVTTLKAMHSILQRNPKMPILSHLCMNVSLKGLTLAATDLELGLARTLEHSSVIEEELLIPVEPVLEFVRELKTDTVQWTTDNHFTLTISADKAKVKVKGLPSNEFPAIPPLPTPWIYSLPTTDLDRILTETLPVIGEEDTRYIMNSIRLQISGNAAPVFEGVGTDGHRLVVTQRETGTWLSTDHNERAILVPKKTGKTIRTLVSITDAEQIAISLSKSLVAFKIGPYQLTSRLMEGNFPSYLPALDNMPITRFTIAKAALEDPLRRVSVINGREGKLITLIVGTNYLTLKASNTDMGEAIETIDIPTEGTDSPFITGFNTEYLLDALETMPGQQCRIQMNDPLSPCLLTTPECPGYKHIVMPLKTP